MEFAIFSAAPQEVVEVGCVLVVEVAHVAVAEMEVVVVEHVEEEEVAHAEMVVGIIVVVVATRVMVEWGYL